MIPSTESKGTAKRVRERLTSTLTTSRSLAVYWTFANPKTSVPSLWKFSMAPWSVSNTTGSRRISLLWREPERKNPNFPALVLSVNVWPFVVPLRGLGIRGLVRYRLPVEDANHEWPDVD